MFRTCAVVAAICLISAAVQSAEKDKPAAAPATAPASAPASAPVTGSQAPPQGVTVARPTYGVLRWQEDWSVLRDRTPTADLWDPIKYVPLNEAGDWYASFGGQYRMRFESWNNFNAGGVPADRDDNDSLLLHRILLHGDFHFGEHVRVFLQGKSALANDDELPDARQNLDKDSLDLQNAFIDLMFDAGDAHVTLRAGRQELLFGKQRLVSPLDWANTRRTFEGGSVIVKYGDWTITPFAVEPVPVKRYEFNDTDNEVLFFGVHATGKTFVPGVSSDLYYYGLDVDRNVTFNGTTGEEERHTLGGRLFGKFGDTGFDYDFEGAYQFGEVGGADVSAFMIGSEVGYKFGDFWGAPRVFLGFDYGSGDDAPGGDVETFNQLFPLGHAYLGWIDFIGRQNIIDVTPGVTFVPFEKMLVTVQAHFFWRASDDDVIYNAGGAPRAAAFASDEREVGQEIDLLIKYQWDVHTALFFGYSHLFAGDYLHEATPAADEDIDFTYFIFEYTF